MKHVWGRGRARVLGIALLAGAALAAGSAALAARDSGARSTPKPTVAVQILAINDFHGNLEPPTGSSGRITMSTGLIDGVGGATYLATHLALLRGANPANTFVVSAGDVIGASPLLSAGFHDEPSIEAFNQLGVDLNAVGNHEFDEGPDELLRMQNGGCHPVDGCQGGHAFEGADFPFLSANVIRKSTGKTLFAPYVIKSFEGVPVGFIGLVTKDTPNIVTASAVADVQFLDEADTANHYVKQLRKLGVKTFVVVVHEGLVYNGFADACNTTPGGPHALDMIDRMNDDIKLIVSGHTHAAYLCNVDGKIVTSAASFGRVVTDIDMQLSRKTGKLVTATVNNQPVTRTVPQDPAMAELVDHYKVLIAPIANRVVGSITATLNRVASPVGETALGDVIADAQLESTLGEGAQIALMNPGGVRTDLNYPGSPAGEGDGNVTYGEIFAVQPFTNILVTMTLTGAQIDAVLEQQWTAARTAVLQPSKTLRYKATLANTFGDRVSEIEIGGAAVDPAASYRVTVNNFLAGGGDGFTALTGGTNLVVGVTDLESFEAYIAAHSPIAPPALDRIVAG